jgi:hypothetical protein
MSKTRGVTWPSVVLKAVEKMVEAIPSEQQVQESIQAIDSLMAFLERLKAILRDQPPQNVRQDVLKASAVLSAFLSSHSAKTLLVEKPKAVRSSANAQAGADQIFKELNSLSLDEIQRRLLDKTLYSVKDLKSLAAHLGIRVDKNFQREDIADTIFKRGFANPRGYQALGGEASRRLEAEARERAEKATEGQGDQR